MFEKGRSLFGSSNPNWKGGLIAKSCEYCGTAYTVKRVNSNSRFCSLSCANRGKGYSIRARISKPCRQCGTVIRVQPSRINRTAFCSPDCHLKWRSKETRGPRNPNWTGGLSRLPYRHNWREISLAIRERDRHQCLGIDCRGKDKRLVVHHIDYDKLNCDQSNLITLCSSCNTRANFDRPSWQKLYEKKMITMARRVWEYEEF